VTKISNTKTILDSTFSILQIFGGPFFSNLMLFIMCMFLQSIYFPKHAFHNTIYITHIKTPTYFSSQVPSSGSYYNKGV